MVSAYSKIKFTVIH